MNLVNLEAAAKAYGDRALLDRVSIGVAAGDRIGVVGRNGAGKTTLLAALAGTAELDSGRATRAGGTRIGYLPQQEVRDRAGARCRVRLAARARMGRAARSRAVITALLSGLDLDQDAKRISGGERRRVALAALLRTTHDLLLLDEPTNHLDLEAIRWLAGYLREHARSYLVVTHDRWFLDAVSDRTWELADGRVHAYDGGYSAYVLARAERARLAEASDQRRRNLLRKELAWLRRGPPARTSKPKFRIAAATALIDGEPPPRDSVELARLATARLGKTVLELDRGHRDRRAADAAGPGDLAARAGRAGRGGGVNGSGKTTLLRLLAGTLSGAGRRAERQRAGGAAGRRCGSAISPRSRSGSIPACGRWRRLSRCAARSASARASRRPASCWTGSGWAGSGSGRRSGSCPAASGGGCSCCWCCWASRTCCCLTSRLTISTSTP